MSDAMTGGTTGAEDRDGTQVQTGTPEPAGADAGLSLEGLQAKINELENFRSKALAEKDTLERLKQENAELRARTSAPPTDPAAAFANPGLGLQRRLQEHAVAYAADPQNAQDSGLIIGLYSELQQLKRQNSELAHLVVTPDQQRVIELQQQYAQRGETISAETARKLLTLDSPPKSNGTTRTDAAEDVRRATEVVATRTVGVPASEVPQRTMTMAQHAAKTQNMTPAQLRAFDAQLVAQGTVVLPE